MIPKKTQEQFEKDVYDKLNNEYTVLGKYKNNSTKISIKHNICNYIWDISPSNLLAKKGKCPFCSNKVKYNTDSFNLKIKSITNNEYELKSEYKNNKTKVIIKHNKCKKEYSVTPTHFLQGNRCPYCCRHPKKDITIIKNEIFEIVGNEYTLLENDYINCKNKVNFKHNKCNNNFSMTIDHFLQGSRCPICNKTKNKSEGELKIEKFLKKNKIDYKDEYIFENCKYKKPLRFDFYIPSINTCIEFDGSQHFETKFYNNEKELLEQHKRDKIKNDFCKNNNIYLLRIPYTSFKNIDKILTEEILIKFND
jgi:hypothetical protein